MNTSTIIMKKQLLFLMLFLVLMGQSEIYATAKTLPKGFGLIQYQYTSIPISKFGGESVNTDGQGQGDFEFKDTNNFRLKNIPKFAGFMTFREQGKPDTAIFNKESPLASSLTYQKQDWTIAMGITDRLTASLTIPFVNGEAKLSDGFMNSMKKAKDLQKKGDLLMPDQNNPGGKKLVTSDLLPEINPVLKAEGMGNLTVGLKYRLLDTFAAGFAMSAGILKTGTSGKDISSPFLELPNSESGDVYTFLLFYDIYLTKNLPIEWTIAYQHTRDSYENMFDNTFRKNTGDLVIISALMPIQFSKKWTLSIGLTYIDAEDDQWVERSQISQYKQEIGGWKDIPNTQTQMLTGDIRLTYQPVPFVKIDAMYTPTLLHGVAGGVYEIPGRFHTTGTFAVSGTVFWKLPGVPMPEKKG
jgi:hypothetical protein